MEKELAAHIYDRHQPTPGHRPASFSAVLTMNQGAARTNKMVCISIQGMKVSCPVIVQNVIQTPPHIHIDIARIRSVHHGNDNIRNGPGREKEGCVVDSPSPNVDPDCDQVPITHHIVYAVVENCEHTIDPIQGRIAFNSFMIANNENWPLCFP